MNGLPPEVLSLTVKDKMFVQDALYTITRDSRYILPSETDSTVAKAAGIVESTS